MKRICKIIFSFLLVILSISLICAKYDFSVLATDTKKVASNAAASYYVDEVVEEKELDFGVKYHHDIAYTSIQDLSYTIGCIAGGESYGNKAIEKNVDYIQNVNVLEVPCDSGVNITPYANFNYGKWTLTSVTAFIDKYEKTHPDKKVVAAINGDYFDISSKQNYPYVSTGGTVSEGNYYKVTNSWLQIGFKNDGSTTSMIGNVYPTISEYPYVEVLDKDNNVIYSTTANKINSEPEGTNTSVFFAFYNDSHAVIPTSVTDSYIISGNEVAPCSTNSVYGLGEIKNIGNAQLDANTFAVKTNNDELKSYLSVGTKVRVQYKYTGTFAGIDNVIGYPENIIVDGNPVIVKNYRHPRTMIGIKNDGTIVMTTCDGRQVSEGCHGVNPVEQAALMSYYGCINAYNLDGGGSTTMVIKENGKWTIKNNYSDSSPRSDGNCLLITVDVPVIETEFTNVKENSLDFSINVTKEVSTYNDLYVSLNGEMKQVVNNKVTFTNLDTHAEYYYKFYAKVNGKMCGIPYDGVVNTAKVKYVLDNISITEGKNSKGKDCYILKVDFTDEYTTIINVVYNANFKRYNQVDGCIYIPKEDYIPSSYSQLQITYDLDDYTQRHTDMIVDFNLEGNAVDFTLKSITDNIYSFFDKLFK